MTGNPLHIMGEAFPISRLYLQLCQEHGQIPRKAPLRLSYFHVNSGLTKRAIQNRVQTVMDNHPNRLTPRQNPEPPPLDSALESA